MEYQKPEFWLVNAAEAVILGAPGVSGDNADGIEEVKADIPVGLDD
jgi:hypothetical protein